MTADRISVPAEPAHDRHEIARGVVLMCAGMVLVPTVDALAKLLAETISPGVVTFGRFFFQTLFTAPLVIWVAGVRGLIPRDFWGNMARGVLIAVASLCFFTAVKYMPLADAIAIFFVEPLILTVLSAVILREEVGWRRRVAVLVGFGGAILVIRPSFVEFGWPALLPLAAATCFAFYLILTRRLVAGASAQAMQFVAGVSGTIVLTVFLTLGFVTGIPDLAPSWPDGREWIMLALVGLIATVAHLFVVEAFRRAPASVLAPFNYMEIVVATALGYLMFSDFPDLMTWLGIAIIVGSGLYVFWRETRVRAKI